MRRRSAAPSKGSACARDLAFVLVFCRAPVVSIDRAASARLLRARCPVRTTVRRVVRPGGTATIGKITVAGDGDASGVRFVFRRTTTDRRFADNGNLNNDHWEIHTIPCGGSLDTQ